METDQIIIKGLRARGRHGTTMQENTFGQEFEVDIIMDIDLRKPCETDDPEDVLVDRKELMQTVSRIIEGPEHCDLPEHLAQKIADRLLEMYPVVTKIELILEQLQPPINGDFDYIAVRIVRP